MKQAMKNRLYEEQESNLCRRGYWLVRESDNQRFFISEDVSVVALERTANKALSEKTGYDYWIDYCMGLDIKRVPAWSNIDQTDRFI